MLKCRELAHLVASGELGNAGRWRRLSAWFHLAMCRHCRRYERQLRSIGEVARKVVGRTDAPGDLESLERRIIEGAGRGDGRGSGGDGNG